MMDNKEKYSATAIVEMHLSCLPTTRENITRKAQREGWKYVEIPSAGKFGAKRLYELPAYATDELHRRSVAVDVPAVKQTQHAPVGAILNGAIVNSKQLASAIRALDEYLKENRLVIDEPEVKAEIVAILYKYLQKDATGEDLQELLRVVMR